jgi:pimeloyl-ACP methyl ester carboxylesterase
MTEDWLQHFLGKSPRERLRMAADPANEKALRAHFGDDVAKAYRLLAGGLDQGHLAADTPTNLIFVPGVMGSLLMSQGLGGVWWIDLRTSKHLDDLALNVNGNGDADPSYKIAPFAVDTSYEGFFAAVLATDDFGHMGCHYDWRRPLAASTHRLRDDIAKAKRENGGKPVHVVAHSMGGLLVRETLRQHPELWNDVGRVVFIGTPHYGSPSIAWYLKNHLKGFDLMAVLGLFLSRDTFRSLWGVLSLLPAPAGIYPGTRANDPRPWRGSDPDAHAHPCANFNMYDAEAWKLSLDATQLTRLQTVLDAADRFHRDLYHSHISLEQGMRDRMAVIAGVGYKTLFRLAYRTGILWEHMEKTSSRVEEDPHREGDGRVPLASAELEFVGETRYVHGEHGALPMLPVVYRDVFRFLRHEGMELPASPAAVLREHLAIPEETEGSAQALERFVPLRASEDDPGYLDFGNPDPDLVINLKERVIAGGIPEFRRLRIL